MARRTIKYLVSKEFCHLIQERLEFLWSGIDARGKKVQPSPLAVTDRI
jgi:hypothetical protein